MSKISAVDLVGNSRCPKPPSLCHHKASGNYYFRVKYHPRQYSTVQKVDVYATNLGLEHWKSEDAALPYASAVWSSYINNTKILDELQKYGGTPRKKPRFEAVTPLAKKLGASKSKQLRSSEKRERAIDIGKKRAGHREALRGALWSSASSLQQTEANRKWKGTYQVLRERGLCVDGMHGSYSTDEIRKKLATNQIIDDTLDAHKILQSCPDFRNEVTLIEEDARKTRSLIVHSPICHPELAGQGVEYCIGLSKMRFRREFNDTVNKNLKNNVMRSLSREVITDENVWRYARRTRDYMHVYMRLAKQGGQLGKEVVINGQTVVDMYSSNVTHQDLEDMRNHCKTHRNISELERKYLEYDYLSSSSSSSSSSAEKQAKRNSIKI